MARQTFHGDPIALLGGNPPEFDIDEVVEFHNDYLFKYRVICHLRHCHQKHNRGYLVKLASGQESVIGGLCAKQHMGGAKFADFDSKLKIAQRVELFRASIANPDFRPGAALEITRGWFETVKVVDTAQRHFRNQHGHTWNTLAAIAAGPGVLSSCRFRGGRVQYGHYEGEWDDWVIKRAAPVAKKPTQVLRGGPFFLQPNVSAAFIQADRLLEGLSQLFNGMIEPTEKRLLSVPKEIVEARRQMGDVIGVVNGYVELTEPSSLTAIAKFIERIDLGQFRGSVTPEGLVISSYIETLDIWRDQLVPLPKVDRLDPDVLTMFADQSFSQVA